MDERERETGWRRYLMWPVKPTSSERVFFDLGFAKGTIVAGAFLTVVPSIVKWLTGY